MSGDVRVAIFDGGVPKGHPLTTWVNPFELPGMMAAPDEYLLHGIGVSSAALFGSIDPKKPLPRPYSDIDHLRVIYGDPGQDPHELYEVLERIEGVLESRDYDLST